MVTEIKTQLDADTGEERRWEEQTVDEVIDLTGENEEEVLAVNQAGSEENQEGNGGEEGAINQVNDEDDDMGNKSEEEEFGERTVGRKGDGAMADGGGIGGGEIDGGQIGGDDKNKNVEEFEKSGRGNLSADYTSANPAPLASPASSSATTEAWEGEARDEDIEMDIVEASCFSRNGESVAPDFGEVLPPPASKEAVRNGNEEAEVDGMTFFPTINPDLAHGTTVAAELGKSPAKESSNVPMARGGSEGFNTGNQGDPCFLVNVNLAPVFPPNPSAPAQLVENPDPSVKILPKHTPLKVKGPTLLFAPGPSTSTLSYQTEDVQGTSSDSVMADSMDRNSDTSVVERAFSVDNLKKCRVQLPRMTLQQEGVSWYPKMKESVKRERQSSKRKPKSVAFKLENPLKVPKTEVLLTGEECIGCGEIFTNMRRHQKLPHDFSCPNDCCERSFTSEEQLRKHMAEKHLVFARGGACEVCGEQFPDDMELAIHISQCGELEDN